jgi:uncharacterized protein YciI
MPLFAVIGLDHPSRSAELRLAHQAAHRAYVVGNDAGIALVGPLLDAERGLCGSFYLFEAETEDEVRAWLQQEPYVQGDVYESLIIRRFEVGKSRLPVQDWPMLASPSPHAD